MPRRTAVTLNPATFSSAWKRSFRRRLLSWYREHQRDLPWRRSRDPYSIWVSEIMLQQTQVATVVPYFQRFMQAFPTIASVAAADEHDVLRLWEGLGYYRRARQLHRAAQLIVANHHGAFPESMDVVRRLPGIGRYTAGAILSIARDARLPIVEANSARLLARLMCYSGSLSDSKGQKALWQLAESLLPANECGAFNQALMELGSMICVPRDPRCAACPVHTLCRAYRAGRQNDVPSAKPKIRFEESHEAAVVVWNKGRVLLQQYEPGQRWAGLWDFLRFLMPDSGSRSQPRRVAQEVHRNYGLRVTDVCSLTTIKHGVTRFRITLDCFTATTTAREQTNAKCRWIRPNDLEQLALSMTARKISHMLTETRPAQRRNKKRPEVVAVK